MNVKPLENIERLFKNLDELDSIYHSSQQMKNTWNESVTFMEELIKAYLEKE